MEAGLWPDRIGCGNRKMLRWTVRLRGRRQDPERREWSALLLLDLKSPKAVLGLVV